MKKATGKRLAELTYEIDVLRKAVGTILDDLACICWQEDGTLSLFSPDDGYPALYYAPEHVVLDPGDCIEDYTSLGRFLAKMKTTEDPYMLYLLASPVWSVIEESYVKSSSPVQAALPSMAHSRAKIIDFKTRREIQA